jgi:hypothetical protein
MIVENGVCSLDLTIHLHNSPTEGELSMSSFPLISVMVLNDKEEQENHQWRILDEREWVRDVFWHAYPMYNKMLISTTSRMNSCRGYSFAKASPCACICSSRPKPNSSQMHSSKPESKRKQQKNSFKIFLAAHIGYVFWSQIQ